MNSTKKNEIKYLNNAVNLIAFYFVSSIRV